MKRLFLLFLLLFNPVFANSDLQDVGIAKYAVLEVLNNNTPLREKPDENAKRITHLFKDSVLFADKQNDKYYRVELNKDYAWVNKKYIETQAIIPEKRFENIEKINFKEDKKKYQFEIETNLLSAYQFRENNNNLDFILFDNRFDPTEIKIDKVNKKFILSNSIENDFKIKYENNKPIFGYDVSLSKKGYLIDIKKAPIINNKKPLKHKIVVVDPGHGGCEKGACAFNLEEKKLNLEISKKLKKELKKKGAKVYLTRTKDKQTDLYKRVEFAKEKQADLLLSIHQNSLPNPKDVDKKHGVGVYYYNNFSYPLAKKIQDNLLSATNFRDDKVNYASFVLTRTTAQPSVLIECGYIIKKEEALKLANKKFQKIIAKAITKGCEEYLKETFNPTQL